MKRLTKITFTITAEEAEVLRKAINFMKVGCSRATAENPCGIKELNHENMKLFCINNDQLIRLLSFSEWIAEEIADLEAWNAEVDHFENLAATINQQQA